MNGRAFKWRARASESKCIKTSRARARVHDLYTNPCDLSPTHGPNDKNLAEHRLLVCHRLVWGEWPSDCFAAGLEPEPHATTTSRINHSTRLLLKITQLIVRITQSVDITKQINDGPWLYNKYDGKNQTLRGSEWERRDTTEVTPVLYATSLSLYLSLTHTHTAYK